MVSIYALVEQIGWNEIMLKFHDRCVLIAQRPNLPRSSKSMGLGSYRNRRVVS